MFGFSVYVLEKDSLLGVTAEYGSARFYNRGDALENQPSLCVSLSVYKCFVWIYISVLHVCLVPLEARREHWIPWNWSH